MTKEEAIAELQADKELYETDICHANDGTPDGRLLTALDMAIEALSANAVDVYKAYEEKHLNIINRIKELQYAIAKTQTIIGKMVESADAEWIPCSERLPKEKQEVYVTVYFIEGDTGRAYGYMDGLGKWHLYSAVEGTLNSGYEVIAWMPLPEPYKGGDDE